MSDNSSSVSVDMTPLLSGGSLSSGSSRSGFLRRRKKPEFSTIQKILRSKPDEYTTVKSLICFPIGCAIAILFYFTVVEPIRLQKETRQVVGACLGFSVAVGFGISTQVRCIITLVLPVFFGKSGRSYVAAFAIVYLIGGPIANLMNNSTEVTRSLSCITQLLANHTASKWELRLKPLGDSMKELQKRGFLTKYIHDRVKKAYGPIKKEVEDQEEISKLQDDTRKADKISGKPDRTKSIEKRYEHASSKSEDEQMEKKWEKKLDYRCEDVFSQGVIRCRKWFSSAYDKCMSALWILGYVVCWPMKLDFFCELVRALPGAIGLSCNSMEVMNPGLGEVYVASKKMTEGLSDKMAVNLQFKVVKSEGDLNLMSAEELRKQTMHQFEKRKVVIDFFMTLLQRMLAFTFVLVFISAYKYHKSYLSDFRYDNNYISDYFRQIDARRRAKDKKVLLPLKKMERGDVIFPGAAKLQKRESTKLVKGTIKLLFRVAITSIIIMLDHLLYSVLDVIGKHSQIDYRQSGQHHIDLKVYGKGFMGDIVKLFLTSFNQKHEIDHVTTNSICLPHPTKVDRSKVNMIFAIYLTVWILLYLQAYGLRVRRLIAGFYYRKREKRRVLYLYNDMLKKRKGFLRHMRHKVRKQVKLRELKRKTNMMVALKQEFPTLCCFLTLFISSKDTCLICEDQEKSGFHRCESVGCNFGYCADCWEDIKERCYACLNKDDDTSSGGSGSGNGSDSDTSSDED